MAKSKAGARTFWRSRGGSDLVSQLGSYLAGSSGQHVATCREFRSSELSTLNIWTGLLESE